MPLCSVGWERNVSQCHFVHHKLLPLSSCWNLYTETFVSLPNQTVYIQKEQWTWWSPPQNLLPDTESTSLGWPPMATHFKIYAVILLHQMWPHMPVLHNAQAMHNKKSKLIKYTEKFKRNYSLSFCFLLDCLVCHFKWQPFVVGFKVPTLNSNIKTVSSGRLRPHLKDSEMALVNCFITLAWIVQWVKSWSGLDKNTTVLLQTKPHPLKCWYCFQEVTQSQQTVCIQIRLLNTFKKSPFSFVIYFQNSKNKGFIHFTKKLEK